MAEEFDFDGDFDFDFEDASVDTKSRTPIEGVLHSGKNAIGSVVRPEQLAKITSGAVKDALPSAMGDKLDALSAVKDEISGPIGDSIMNVRREGDSFLSGVSSALPDDSTAKKLVDRLQEAVRVEDRSYGSREQTADEIAATQAQNVFGESSVDSTIEKRLELFKTITETETRSRMLAEASILNDFNKNVTDKYYRKSLELQFKSTFFLGKMFELNKSTTLLRNKQFEVLVKNTALPDMVKVKGPEYLAFKAKEKLAETSMALLGGNSMVKNMGNVLKERTVDKLDSLGEIIGMGTMAVEARNDLIESGMDPLEATIETIISSNASKYGKKAAQKGFEYLGKRDDVKENLRRAQRFTSDFGATAAEELEELETKEMTGDLTILDKLSKMLYGLAVDAEGTNSLRGTSLQGDSKNDIVGFDSKAKRSITTVIPTLLAKILKEVSASNGKSSDELIFDHETSTFKTSKHFINKFDKSIVGSAAGISSTMGDAFFKVLDKDNLLTASQKTMVKREFLKHIMAGNSSSPFRLLKEGFTDNLPDDVAAIVAASLTEISTSTDLDTRLLIEDYNKVAENVRGKIDNIHKSSIDEINKLKDLGLGDKLSEFKLLDNDGTATSMTGMRNLVTNAFDVNEDESKKKKFLRGFSKGGATGEGDSTEVKGVVHANEYVISENKLDSLLNTINKVASETNAISEGSVNRDNVIEKVTDILDNIKNGNSDSINSTMGKAKVTINDTWNNINDRFGFEYHDKIFGKSSADIKQGILDDLGPVSKYVDEFKDIDPNTDKGKSRLKSMLTDTTKLMGEYGFNKTVMILLKGKPLPKENEAEDFYRGILVKIDPTGLAIKRIEKDPNWVSRFYTLHMDAISSDDIGDLKNYLQKNTSKIKGVLKGILPPALYNMLAENKVFAKLTGSIGHKLGTAGKKLFKGYMNIAKTIGYTGKEVFHRDGKVRLNPFAFGEFIGKTAYRSTGILRDTIKDIGTNEIKGIGKDLYSIGKGIISGEINIQDAPIPDMMKEKLRLGTLDIKDVSKLLPEGEQRKAWIAWYRERRREQIKELRHRKQTMMAGKKAIKDTITGKRSFTEAKEDSLNFVKEKSNKIFDMFKAKFDLSDEDIKEGTDKAKGKVKGSSAFRFVKNKATGAFDMFKNKSKFDFDGDGDRDGNYTERLAEINRKRKSKGKEALKGKEKESKGMLGLLLTAGAMLSGKLISFFGGGFLKSLGKGAKGILKATLGTLGKSILGGLGKLGKSILGGVGKLGKVLVSPITKLLGLFGASKLLGGLDLDGGGKNNKGKKPGLFSKIMKSLPIIGAGADLANGKEKSYIRKILSIATNPMSAIKETIDSIGSKGKAVIAGGFASVYNVSKSLLSKVGIVDTPVSGAKASELLKIAAKSGSAAKLVGKYVFSMGKRVPILSLLLGGGQALYYAVQGDWAKAGVSAAAGLTATMVPGAGGVAALAGEVAAFSAIDAAREKEAADAEKTVITKILDKKPTTASTPDVLDIAADYINKTKKETTDFWGGLYDDYFGNSDSEDKPTGGGAAEKRVRPTNSSVAAGELRDGSNGYNYLSVPSRVNVNGLTPEYKKLLYGMAEEYNELTGKKIAIFSAYRSIAYQTKLYKDAKNKGSVATPGRSMHNFGLAVDVNKSHAKELIDLGLVRKYGFTFPVGAETWHMEAAMCQLAVGRCRSDAAYAASMVASSPGRGGPGWGYEKGQKKYSRNKQFQVDEMGATSVVVTKKDKDIAVITKADKKNAKIALEKRREAGISIHKTNKNKSRLESKGYGGSSSVEAILAKSEAEHTAKTLKETVGKASVANRATTVDKSSNNILIESLSVQRSMLGVLKDIKHEIRETRHENISNKGNKGKPTRTTIIEKDIKNPISVDTSTF